MAEDKFFDVLNTMRRVKPYADIDGLKGPFNSVQEGLDATRDLRLEGKSFYVLENGKRVEYVFEGGIEDSNLVRVTTPSGGEGGGIEDLASIAGEGLEVGTDGKLKVTSSVNIASISPTQTAAQLTALANGLYFANGAGVYEISIANPSTGVTVASGKTTVASGYSVSFNKKGSVWSLASAVSIPSYNDNELRSEIDLIKTGGSVNVPRVNILFNLTSYYRYATPGAVSNSAYGHTRTEKFLLKKGEKLKYGVNTYTAKGGSGLLNIYNLDDSFKQNILTTETNTISIFIEGEYVATEDVLIGMSDYTEGNYGTAYAYIEEYTIGEDGKGLNFLINREKEISEDLENLKVKNNETLSMYDRGRAVQNLSDVKKYGIIVAGQSNTEGRVPIAEAPSYITSNDKTVPNVLMWNGGTKAFAPFKFGVNTGSSAGTTTSNFYAYDAIASYLLGQNKGKDIYLIKTARGGTAIDVSGSDGGGYWTPYTEQITSGRKLIEDLKLKVLTALRDNPDLEIKAVMWHQGEGDSATATARVKYYQNFKNVIAYIRGIVGNPKLPFIFGTQANISQQYTIEVDLAQRKIASEDPFVYLCDMSNGTLLDAYHFDAVSTNDLGDKMFQVLKDL